MHYIYADFHKARRLDEGGWTVPLVCWGTLVDLSRFSIRLVEGMSLAVCMDSDEHEDMAFEGVARFARESRKWWIDYMDSTFHHVPAHHHGNSLVCWSCKATVDGVGVQPGQACSTCGAALEGPWAPPEDA